MVEDVRAMAPSMSAAAKSAEGTARQLERWEPSRQFSRDGCRSEASIVGRRAERANSRADALRVEWESARRLSDNNRCIQRDRAENANARALDRWLDRE